MIRTLTSISVATICALCFGAEAQTNAWQLIHEEDASGGKRFAKAIFAESVGQVYL